jgi:HEPN domain-containing protein
MRDIRSLVARALKDMELAKRYRQRKEYAATTLLYNKAIEKVLKALFISKTRKDPPLGASAVYLASNIRMPEEIMTGLLSLQETDDEVLWSGNEATIMTYERIGRSMKAEHKLIQMDELATRLIDSAMKCARA